MKPRWFPFLLAACALLLAGCKFQATTRVQSNGRGELRSEVGFTPEERQNLVKQNSAKPQDFCNTSGQAGPASPAIIGMILAGLGVAGLVLVLFRRSAR